MRPSWTAPYPWLCLLEKAKAHRPDLSVFEIIADLARQYHAAGNVIMVAFAVATPRDCQVCRLWR
jgi:hypothetical protein